MTSDCPCASAGADCMLTGRPFLQLVNGPSVDRSQKPHMALDALAALVNGPSLTEEFVGKVAVKDHPRARAQAQ